MSPQNNIHKWNKIEWHMVECKNMCVDINKLHNTDFVNAQYCIENYIQNSNSELSKHKTYLINKKSQNYLATIHRDLKGILSKEAIISQ